MASYVLYSADCSVVLIRIDEMYCLHSSALSVTECKTQYEVAYGRN